MISLGSIFSAPSMSLSFAGESGCSDRRQDGQRRGGKREGVVHKDAMETGKCSVDQGFQTFEFEYVT